MIKVSEPDTVTQRMLRYVSLDAGDTIALMGVAFFVGVIVQKIWADPACFWPI